MRLYIRSLSTHRTRKEFTRPLVAIRIMGTGLGLAAFIAARTLGRPGFLACTIWAGPTTRIGYMRWKSTRTPRKSSSQPLTNMAPCGVMISARPGKSWRMVLAWVGISALQVAPSDGQSVFAGTDGDGLYRSWDGGQNWTHS